MNGYIGDPYQLYGVLPYELSEGKGRGMRLLHLKNGKGLEMDVSLDRNGDISSLSYKGTNLSYLSSCGYVHSSYYERKGNGFLSSFTAGFLTTCGLTHFGASCVDEGEELGLHGSIANTPTSNHSYEVKESSILVRSETRDEEIFSHKLVLNREIEMSLDANRFSIHDLVSNRGDIASPLMLLYHMNLGYPLLDEDAELKVSSLSVQPRTAHAKEGLESWMRMEKPQRGYIEKCYYHEMKDPPYACLFNPKLGFGVKISYEPSSLTHFVEWKMMGYRDYVLGLEPGNAYPDGRDKARADGSLKTIAPGETISYDVCVEIVDKEEFDKLN